MKKNLILLSMLVFAIVSTAFSQSKNEKAVADAVEQLRSAMVSGDKTALENITSDKLSYGHSGGHVEGKEEFVQKIISGASDFVTIDLTEQTISISDKVAVVRHVLTAKTNDNGKPGDVHLKVLLVWQKQKGGWKLLARQAVKFS